jgi:type II secretory pathway pseudopilin PulG
MCGRDSLVQAGDRTEQRRARECGVTLVELMLAFVVLTVAILGTISTVISVDSLQQRVEAQDAATRAASDTLERLRDGDLATQLTWFAAHPTFTDGTQNVPSPSRPSPPPRHAQPRPVEHVLRGQ